jgi:hypothetical protein
MRRGTAGIDDRRLAYIGLTRELVEYLARYRTLPRRWATTSDQ